MARSSAVVSKDVISSVWANALITDYVSQSDTTEQTLASNLNIGAKLLKTTNLAIKEYNADNLIVRNAADNTNKNLIVNAILTNAISDTSGGAINMTDATVSLKDGSTIGGDAICKIKTGTYTGDGAVSQGITGVGFSPKMVWINPNVDTDGQSNANYYKTDQYGSTFCIRLRNTDTTEKDNSIISLDADGFTVDDNGADEDPNKNGTTYQYIAWG